MFRAYARARLFAAATVLILSATPAFANGLTPEDAMSIDAGHFVWRDDAMTGAPIRIVVSITDQRAYVYQGNWIVAISAVSTGKEGHETPTGTFRILEKAVTHHSNKYDNAAMPYMQRLTWDGVALHAGHDPGFPNSHGCIRLPLAFAKKLYAATKLGGTVTVTDEPIVGGEDLPATDMPVVTETVAAKTPALEAGPDPLAAPIEVAGAR